MFKCLNVKMRDRGFTPLENTSARQKYRENNSLTGFTILELIIAVSAFTLIIGSASGLFMSSLVAQRRILSLNPLLSQVSYAEEYMSRAIRMARKDTVGSCVPAGSNFQITTSGEGIKFKNYQNECQEFYRDVGTGQLMEAKDGAITGALTADNFWVESFNVRLSGEIQADDLQPLATFFLDIRGEGQKPELRPQIRIQTSVSQRNLDVQK